MTITIDIRLVLLLASTLVLTGAKKHRLIDPIPWEEAARYVPKPLEDVVTDRAPALAGDPVPFDGWVLGGKSFSRVVESYEDTSRALKACYLWREQDRVFADRIHASTVEGLRACRNSKPRDFAAGAAIGFAGCAGVGWAVESAR